MDIGARGHFAYVLSIHLAVLLLDTPDVRHLGDLRTLLASYR
jgi:hypothetical protein